MNWNIFSPTKRVRKRGKAKDSFDEFINVIEKFAPREHLSSREAFYYNYKMMPSCRKSLPNPRLARQPYVNPLWSSRKTGLSDSIWADRSVMK